MKTNSVFKELRVKRLESSGKKYAVESYGDVFCLNVYRNDEMKRKVVYCITVSSACRWWFRERDKMSELRWAWCKDGGGEHIPLGHHRNR